MAAVLLAAVSRLSAQTGDDANQQILSIQDALDGGDLSRADLLLRSALRAHPVEAGLLNLRGVVHARRGELAPARQDFLSAVELSPTLMPAWQNLARACQAVADQDPEAAACSQKAWKRVADWRPGDAEATRGMAVSLERLGKYADSLRWLAKAPSDPAAFTTDLMIRCLDLAALKKAKEANEAAKLLGDRSDLTDGDLEAMATAGSAVTIILTEALDSRGALKLPGLKRMALAYEAMNRLSEARNVLERAALADPKNAGHLLELARVAEKQNDHEGALGYLGHARELTPNDAQVHFLFGVVAAEMDLPMEARQSFDRALELSPGNADYNYAMGAVTLTTRDAGTAAGYFRKVVASRPNDAKGHYALGVAEFTSGDYPRARAEMHGVEASPDIGGAADFFLGRMARLDGDSGAAKAYLLRSIRLMPKFAESHTELARVLLLESKYTEAEAELRCALALDASSFQANAQLLIIYKRSRDSRAEAQAQLLKQLDEQRSRRAEMMLRGVEIRP